MTGSQAQPYKLSFLTGGLLSKEAISVASAFLVIGDWAKTRAAVMDRNLVQQRTDSSTLRVSREVINRLATLGDDELRLVVDGTASERGQLLWSAVCRQYLLVEEFAREVVRERFILLTPTLSYDEYDSFMRSKALWHEELGRVTPSTYKKLRTQLFRMLREAELVSQAGRIVQPVMSTRVVDLLRRRGPDSLTIFPIPATENGLVIP